MAKAKPESVAADNIVFGIHAVEALLRHTSNKSCTLYLQQRADKRIQQLNALARQHKVNVHLLTAADFETYAQRYAAQQNHQGVIAVCHQKESTTQNLPELLANLATPPLLLILDGIQDPHNLGACLRSANAAGVHAVIIPKDRAAPMNATVRKVASGAAEITPVISVTNLARTLRWLKTQGVWLYGMAGEATQLLYQANLSYPAAFILGAEGEGLRHLTKEHCDELLAIPMAGTVSSLNVSVAAGICLFEAVRQRTGK